VEDPHPAPHTVIGAIQEEEEEDDESETPNENEETTEASDVPVKDTSKEQTSEVKQETSNNNSTSRAIAQEVRAFLLLPFYMTPPQARWSCLQKTCEIHYSTFYFPHFVFIFFCIFGVLHFITP